MKRVLIIGCPGSGKTTLALELARITGLPVTHLDALYWRDGWQHVDRETFDALLAQVLSKDEWIIDGNYSRTVPERLAHCDTVVFLDYPMLTSLSGAFRRILKNRGKSRPDMGGNCPERFDIHFFKYIWQFKKASVPKLLSQLQAVQGIEVIRLTSRRQTRQWLAALPHV